MNTKDNREMNDQSVIIEDLSPEEVEEIKGGLSMNYSKIEFEYKPQKPDGSLD